jgi:hypothetical protein
MSDGVFFKLEMHPSDTVGAHVISYSTKWSAPEMMGLVARELRRFAEGLESAYPVSLVWREPWNESETETETETEMVTDNTIIPIPIDDDELDVVSEWRRKRGLDLG